MPSSVGDLLAAVDLQPDGFVRWGDPVPVRATGVYIVSLGSSTADVKDALAAAPISVAALEELLEVCPGLRLDGQTPTVDELVDRLSAYWLPDECVLYMGLAGQPLRTRVRQYYRTPLGAPRPHKGGWWLKTLSVIDDLFVHYSSTGGYERAEAEMLRSFANGVSEPGRASLPSGDPVMPFANLRDADWRRKAHGVTGAIRTGRPARRSKTSARVADPPARPATIKPRSELPLNAHLRTQTITAADIKGGRIRIPCGPTKDALPAHRQEIPVSLHGRDLTCRWDPRHGPPERSGVIGVGKAVAEKLLEVGDVLGVEVATDGAVRLS